MQTGLEKEEFSLKGKVGLVLGLIIWPILSMWPIGLVPYMMKWDMADQFFPYRYFLAECLWNGHLPLWNPYQHLGWPFHADPQSGFWYPVSWLFALLFKGKAISIHAEFLFHVILGGIGFFRLLRSFSTGLIVAFLFALAFQSCGIFINNAQHLTWIIAFAWLPWVVHSGFQILKTGKPGHIPSAAFFSMMMLTGGYPIFSVITHYFLGVLFGLRLVQHGWQKKWRNFLQLSLSQAGFYLVFVLLSGGFLISFFTAKPFISRGIAMTLSEALEGSFPAKALVSLVAPFSTVVGVGFSTDLSMLNVYLGLIPLIFACSGLALAFAKRTPANISNEFGFRVDRIFVFFGIFSLLAAMGDAFPLRSLLFHFVPLMDSFRFPAIFRAFFVFSFLVVGAVTMARIFKNEHSLVSRYFRWLPVFFAFGLLVTVISLAVQSTTSFSFPPIFDLSAMPGWLEKSSLSSRIMVQSLVQIPILLLIAVFWFRKAPKPGLIYFFLLLSVIDLFLATSLNFPSTSVAEKRVHQFQRSLDQMPRGFPSPSSGPVANFKGYDKGLYPGWYNQNIFTKEPGFQGFNSFYLRKYMAFYDAPERDSIMQLPFAFVLGKNGEVKEITLTFFAPNQIVLDYDGNDIGKLIVFQSFFPGWQASVNGEKTEIQDMDEFPFLNLAVNGEAGQVEFRYAPSYLKIPGAVSLSLLFGIMAVLFFQLVLAVRKNAP